MRPKQERASPRPTSPDLTLKAAAAAGPTQDRTTGGFGARRPCWGGGGARSTGRKWTRRKCGFPAGLVGSHWTSHFCPWDVAMSSAQSSMDAPRPWGVWGLRRQMGRKPSGGPGGRKRGTRKAPGEGGSGGGCGQARAHRGTPAGGELEAGTCRTCDRGVQKDASMFSSVCAVSFQRVWEA